MIIIHDMDTTALPRLVAASLAARLRVMPAVVLTGARQTGKSTLSQDLVPGSPPVYGQSITDACISLAETDRLLEQLAKAQLIRGSGP